MVKKVRQYWRFTVGLPQFLRHPLSYRRASRIIRHRFDERETRFLSLMQHGVYQQPRNPYRTLLSLAGCAYRDLELLVRCRGLEFALQRLYDSGVFVTVEEFKGRRPAVRNGKVFRFRESDFDNPYLARAYQAQTSGSTGPGTRAMIDLDFLEENAVYYALRAAAHEVWGWPCALWYPELPSGVGLSSMLRYAKIGMIPKRWFTPLLARTMRATLRNRLLLAYTLTGARAWGAHLPRPRYVGLEEADVILAWLAQAQRQWGHCVLSTFASAALRACAVAKRKGTDLCGTVFFVSGEPLTQTKSDLITGTGARVVPVYAMTELGNIGCGCPANFNPEDVHLFSDNLLLLPKPLNGVNRDQSRCALLFTAVSFAGPKLVLNYQVDDSAVITTGRCGCMLEDLGFSTHLQYIRSLSKLTSEGMTLLGVDVLHIVEEVLPGRFGGDSTCYQIAEEEDSDGHTRIRIRVHPDVGPVAEDAVRFTFLNEVRRAAHATPELWARAGTVRIDRIQPIRRGGKVWPLHVASRIE